MSLKDALRRSPKADLLRVALPRGCNMQQMPELVQQADATTLQQGLPEASNGRAFERNTAMQHPCNSTQNGVQQMASKKGAVVAPPLHEKERGIWKVIEHGRVVGWLVGMTFPEAVGRAQARWGRVDLVKAEKAEEESNV